MAPDISVILVSYHTGHALFDALAALRTQKVAFEAIVVDNGNPPETVQRLRDLAAQDTRFVLITGHGNVGFSCGNNLGVKASRGRYILILNPDGIVRDDTLAKLLTHAATLTPPFMLGARILNEDGSDQRGCRRELLTPTSALVEALHLGRIFPHHRLNQHHEAVPSTLTSIPAISGAFMFLSRKDYDLIGGFDEGYFLHVEDLDICYRFRKAGGEIYFAPDAVVTHIGGTSEAASDFVERHKTRGFLRYFHNHFASKTPWMLMRCLDIAIWMRYFMRKFKGWRKGHL